MKRDRSKYVGRNRRGFIVRELLLDESILAAFNRIMRILMFVIFIAGLALSYVGYSTIRRVLVQNYADALGSDKRVGSISKPGYCYSTTTRGKTSRYRIFEVKFEGSDLPAEVTDPDCLEWTAGQLVELVNTGDKIRGEWALPQKGFSIADIVLGPIVLLLGIGGTFVGARRVLWGFPAPKVQIPN